MPISGYHLRPQALTDLEDIYQYSYQAFGENRAIQYTVDLDNSFQSLTENPHLGVSRNDISAGLRALLVQSHYVFYRVTNNQIVVVRVLHASTDYDHSYSE